MRAAETTTTRISPRVRSTLVRPRMADCSSSPISTNRAPLSTNVPSDQNAIDCWRVLARFTRGPAWLKIRPATTTARTPEAWMASAARNAVNGVSSAARLLSSGSSSRRRTWIATQAVATPAAAPPT
jgi:hypothetical protein